MPAGFGTKTGSGDSKPAPPTPTAEETSKPKPKGPTVEEVIDDEMEVEEEEEPFPDLPQDGVVGELVI